MLVGYGSFVLENEPFFVLEEVPCSIIDEQLFVDPAHSSQQQPADEEDDSKSTSSKVIQPWYIL